METIQVQQNGDVFSCDIGISKEEWLEILKDENTPQTYKETVLRFFYYPAHRGSCTAVSNEMGGNAQLLNANITNLGKYVQKRLDRFQVTRPNGKPCFWIIPMCEGKDLPKGSEGTFEWELRPELVEAIKDYLYWYLVECYKVLRKDIPVNDSHWTELYKWQLITVSKGKTPSQIVSDHVAHPGKAAMGGFENLIDAVRDNKTLNYLVENNPSGLQEVLNKLADETKHLNRRLADFKTGMVSLLPSSGYNSKANDERTASTILTCINPEKYTLYKYDVYSLFCKYLGLLKKPTGQCYGHFLNLLKPLSVLSASDKELQQIVGPSLEGQEKSDLLLAQDILWILLIEFPNSLGYIRPLLFSEKQRLWLWSITISEGLHDTLAIGSSAKTIKDFRPYKSKNALRKVYQQDVGTTDLKIPDAYWSFLNEVKVGDIVVAFEPKKGNGKQYHLLHGWGLFNSDCTIVEDDENPMRREVEWHSFLKIPVQNTEMGNSIFFQGTTDKQALHIKKLLNINTEIEMESKYKKYIDLLEANHNLILTGAPGTGKTFMAKAIAEEMGAEVGFVQFHPSYDYTDFVEGLRPISADTHGNIGFIRKNGVFKEFCKSATLCNKSSNTQDSLKEALYAFKKDLQDNGDKEIKSFRSSTMILTTLDKRNNIAVAHISSPWSVTDDKMLDYLQNGVCHENDTYTKSIGDYIKKQYCNPIDYRDKKSRPFVFIIDEINRGEISKIFGELFFSIDPGYRGEKGKVDTQYQNLIEEGDVFKDGFYVPENVYIIGTMNDIDRSVESMDFAMRRRFAWQEVTAEESYANMIENEPEFATVKDEIKQRMFSLNKAIAETEGLDEAYQIGAAYFRKYLDYQDKENPFKCLWENHLKGLLFEYLRGNRRAKELLEKLHKAYNKTGIDE